VAAPPALGKEPPTVRDRYIRQIEEKIRRKEREAGAF
jgi:hypothetical protein